MHFTFKYAVNKAATLGSLYIYYGKDQKDNKTHGFKGQDELKIFFV